MREIVAILVLVAATTFIDVGAKEASFITGFAMLICLAALIYLSMALAERFNPNVKKWHRITPGKKTEMDEADWENISPPKKSPPIQTAPPIPNTPPTKSALSIKNMPPPPLPQEAENIPPPPPPPPPETVFYDSGYDDSAGKKPQKKEESPCEFDDIFGEQKPNRSR